MLATKDMRAYNCLIVEDIPNELSTEIRLLYDDLQELFKRDEIAIFDVSNFNPKGQITAFVNGNVEDTGVTIINVLMAPNDDQPVEPAFIVIFETDDLTAMSTVFPLKMIPMGMDVVVEDIQSFRALVNRLEIDTEDTANFVRKLILYGASEFPGSIQANKQAIVTALAEELATGDFDEALFGFKLSDERPEESDEK